MYYEQTKHIDVRYHFTSDIISHGVVKVKKVSTYANPINMMTKIILVTKFENF